MIFQGDKAGHPWHGVWDSSTGKITTPAAVEIDLTGDAPSGQIIVDDLELPPGDAFRVAVPGMPAVTTTTAESAAGKTWLNYGIMSGLLHRISGVNLGGEDDRTTEGEHLGWKRWLYVDPDKVVWVATMSFTPASGSVRVDFTRFGDFRPEATPDDCYETASLGTGMGSPPYWMIDDISPSGDCVLVTTFYYDPTSDPLQVAMSGKRFCYGGFRVNVSGTPPDATVSATWMMHPEDKATTEYSTSTTADVVWYRSSDGDKPERVDEIEDGGSYTWADDNQPAFDPPEQGDGLTWRYSAITSAYSRQRIESVFIGLAFSATGTPEVVTSVSDTSADFTCSYSYTINYHPTLPDDYQEYVASQTGSQTDDIVRRVMIGGATIIEITGSSTTDVVFTPGGYGTGDDSISRDSSVEFAGVEHTDSSSAFPSGGQLIECGYHPTAFSVPDVFSTDADYYDNFVDIRYGNGLYGIARVRQAADDAEILEVEYIDVGNLAGTSAATFSATALGQHFATCHPVTGTITRSTTPVCVV